MQYGPIVDIDLKIPPRPPGYAFIEVMLSSFYWRKLKQGICLLYTTHSLNFPKVCKVFCILPNFLLCILLQFEDARDAEDAIRGRDGYNFDGYRLRVGIFLVIILLCFCFKNSTS